MDCLELFTIGFPTKALNVNRTWPSFSDIVYYILQDVSERIAAFPWVCILF